MQIEKFQFQVTFFNEVGKSCCFNSPVFEFKAEVDLEGEIISSMEKAYKECFKWAQLHPWSSPDYVNFDINLVSSGLFERVQKILTAELFFTKFLSSPEFLSLDYSKTSVSQLLAKVIEKRFLSEDVRSSLRDNPRIISFKFSDGSRIVFTPDYERFFIYDCEGEGVYASAFEKEDPRYVKEYQLKTQGGS